MRKNHCFFRKNFLGVRLGIVSIAVFSVLALSLYAGELAGARFDKGNNLDHYEATPYFWTGNFQIALTSPLSVAVSEPKPNRPEAFPKMRPLWDTKVELPKTGNAAVDKTFAKAEQNSREAAEMFFRSRRFIDGWLAHADPKTGLIPRNLGVNRDFWNARDAAADNYPFMVITSSLTDRKLFEGRMHDMLKTETRLTRRLGNLPDTWSFKKQAFLTDKPNQFEMRFGGAEYVKDGLLPITEWLGDSPWRDRMIGIVDDLFKYADFDTPYGKVPTSNVEVHGDLLQMLSRCYWMTGDKKYLGWGCRLGDYYLLGNHHPTRNFKRLSLNDHGCEIISGLAELYLATRSARPEKAKQYKKPLYAIYDKILKIGRTPEGQLYDSIHPKKGTHSKGITDNWGYNYLGFYTLYLLDGKKEYRDAVVHALKNLPKLIEYDWGDVADEYADSIEGALSLYNREPVPEAAYWMDSEIHKMWSKQTPDGVIEAWHGDGNVARTAIMYAMWKTRGLHVEPWRADVRIGAEQVDGKLYIVLVADTPWSGTVKFDTPRHRLNMHLPMDYPRLNQFPEWFTVEAKKSYQVKNRLTSQSTGETGKTLSTEGYPVQLKTKEPLLLEVTAP